MANNTLTLNFLTSTTDFSNFPRVATSAHAVFMPLLAVIAIIILIVPLIFHWRARNTGAWALIGYLIAYNVLDCINALIWPNANFADWYDGTGLCDIEVRLIWPMNLGICASTLCITRSLAIVLDVDRTDVNPTKAQRRRKLLVELAICFALPIIDVVLIYIVQIHRYLILAISGCIDAYDNGWPTLLTVYIWPLVLVVITLYYAFLVIFRLRRHRASISSILSSQSLNTTRFLRLFITSISLVVIYAPLTIFFFCINVTIPWTSYSWAKVHDPATWNIIIYLPEQGVITFDRYIPAIMGMFVFLFFGMGEDAMNMYKTIAVKCGLGHCFPALLRERRCSYDDEPDEPTWLGKLSLVRACRKYLDKVSASRSTAGMTNASTPNDTTTATTSSRKASVAVIEHASAPSSSAPTTPTLTDASVRLPAAPASPRPTGPSLSRLLPAFLRRTTPTSSTHPEKPRRGSSAHILASPDAGADVEAQRHAHRGISAQIQTQTQIWSPNAARGAQGEGRFERLKSVATQGGREGGGVRVKTAVGVVSEKA